jgi:hypothetical protein
MRASVFARVWGKALTAMNGSPQNGWTSLLRASQNGHLEVVGALLAKGADMEAKTDVSIARACALYLSLTLMHMQLGDLVLYLSSCLSRRRFGCKA